MNNNIVNVELSLLGEEYISELRRKIYEDELKEINSKFPLNEDEIDIKQSYLVKNDQTLEVGFFIRNTSKSNISIEKMPLVMQDKNGNSVLSKIFDFKGQGIIPPLSGKPYTVTFELDDISNIIDCEEYTIKFDNTKKYESFSSVETKIENIPIDFSFEEEQNLRNFISKLETLRKDEITITLYKIGYTSYQGLECILIIRNGYEKEITLEKLPISIINEKGVTVARKICNDTNELIKVGGNKSIYTKIKFLPNEVFDKDADLSKCRIECK